MKHLYGLAIMLALFSPLALAVDHYQATVATTALTIQQPAAAATARRITFGDAANNVAGASVYCASASTATLSWSGTAASATTVAEVKIIGTANASGATIWSGSNVGAGTTGQTVNIAAGETINYSLGWFLLQGNGTTKNLTISTSNTCTITFNYSAT